MKKILLPAALSERTDFLWNSFFGGLTPEWQPVFKPYRENPEAWQRLQRCWAGSEVAASLCEKHPDWLLQLFQETYQEKPLALYQQELREQLGGVDSEEELLRQLRLFRNKNLLRVIWHDFNRHASTMQTTRELSYLADTCLQEATSYLYRQLCAIFGTPRNEQGEAQSMLVLGMGKLGAFELNLSSDIDLIFVYPEEGETDGAASPISNHQFFVKLGQKLIKAIDSNTADGFVFRVDMALRPYGESGALACAFAALENYYQEQGRSWERYAMVKARVVVGEGAAAIELMKLLRPFTYRRYIDYSVIESLRNMKALINREVKRRGYEHNIKLGAGGIREIEFIAQAFQLIRGGRDTELQQRELLTILGLLEKKQLLPAQAVHELMDAYLFLRDVEHALQGYRDEQTQQLPMAEDEASRIHRQRIAFIMQFENWDTFYQTLQAHRQRVAAHFRHIAAFESEDDLVPATHKMREPHYEWLLSLWEQDALEEKLALARNHCENNDQLTDGVTLLHEFQQSRAVRHLQGEGSERLHAFIPRLLQEVFYPTRAVDETAWAVPPGEVLRRLIPFVTAVLRRSAYLTLLNENPQALEQLVLLSAASPWIAEEISQHPVLLDELLDERSLYTLPDRQALADALRQEVMRIPLHDLEAQMEAMRYFKRAHRLRVAACEVTGRLPLMKVSDYLTFIAEAILNHALAVAWHGLSERYGVPLRRDGGLCDPAFIIVGYGKLGGLELSHNSDLDVVFIHDADPFGNTNHAEHAIDNATYYARLGQRIIHILETRTPSGQLYEIDTQLRPSGNSGLLVASREAFAKYQQEQAWTWEHQALVRARVVAGCPLLAQQFDEIRNQVLARPRDMATLRREVVEMREKMIQHLSSREPDSFDLKQDHGGIVDIEFMVQFAVLAWAHRYPALLRWPDNIRILEELAAAQLLGAEEAQQLTDAYKSLRCLAHHRALQQQGSRVSQELLKEERRWVTSLWQKLFSAS